MVGTLEENAAKILAMLTHRNDACKYRQKDIEATSIRNKKGSTAKML
jgi:hypothetical protein